jgi:16S rRNA (cytosine1402-N4)-methyltransferase
MTDYHQPVLLKESVDALQIHPRGLYVDVTFGGGGHSREMVGRLEAGGCLYAFDQDEEAIRNVWDDKRLVFIPSNFRYMQRFLRLKGVDQVDGILADLGVSSHQFDEGERGFSYRFDALLDMRMNAREGKTAADVLNTLDEEELQRIFSVYGEVRNAKTLAQAVVARRDRLPFVRISDLTTLLDGLAKGNRMRYFSQVFQALRITVNEEMEALEEFLLQSLRVLKEGGRLAVITYHSLEDRMVKNFFKTGNVQGEIVQDFYGNIERPWRLLTRKPILPSAAEVARNPRARSAKLRVAEKA